MTLDSGGGSIRPDRGVKRSTYIPPHARFDTDLTGSHAQSPVGARLQQRDLVRASGQAADVDQAQRLQQDQAIVEGVAADAIEQAAREMHDGQASTA